MAEAQGGPKACDLVIRNAYVVTCDADRKTYPDGAVAVAGRDIVAVGPTAEVERAWKGRRSLDAGGGLVHPGLIDMHYHATFHLVGKMIDEAPATSETAGPWVANQYVRLINAIGDEEEHANARLACLDMALSGVTFFMEAGTAVHPDSVAAAARDTGIRASLAEPWLWDRRGPQLADIAGHEPSLERCMRLLGSELWRNRDADDLVRGHVAIEGMGSQSDELALAARDKAAEAGAPFTMHQSQSFDDAAFDRARFGKAPMIHHAETGLLSRNCVFSHVNILEDAELAPIAESGMSVIWSINSWYYGSREKLPSPMPRLHGMGAHLTLGLDVSKAWSFGTPMIQMAYLMARDQGEYLSPEDLLYAHTMGGARAMMMEERLGSLEPGKRADLVIRTNRIPECVPARNLVRQHLLVAGSRSIHTVIVDGRVVVAGGRAALVDEGEVMARAQAASERMAERAGLKG